MRVKQFLRPNGEVRWITTERSPEIENLATAIVALGHQIEAEVLMTGEVSLAIEDHENEMTFAVEVVPNGPEVLEAVDRIVIKTAKILGIT